MTAVVADDRPPERRGRTVVAGRALDRLATLVSADAAGVPRRRVTTALRDHRGALAVAVTTPVVTREGAGAVADQAEALRRGVVAGLRDLAGRTVGVVDVRFSGVHEPVERRVR